MTTATDALDDDRWVPAGFTRDRLTTNGTTLSVLHGGRTGGPVIVLLHGWPQTGRAWRHVMGPLAQRYTVVVPDLRGAGDSDRPLEGYRKIDQADDVRGVLEALGLAGPSVVVGHDIGGMVALAWAARYPDEVAALVTLDVVLPGLGLEEAMDVARGGMWHFGFFMQPGIPEMLFDGHELEFFTATFTALSNPGTFDEADLAWHAAAYRGRDRLRGGFSQYHDLLTDGADNRAMLARGPLTMPVLAVGGAGRVAEEVGRELAPHTNRLTSRVAPTGHFVAEEAPEWLLAALDDLSAQLTTP
ncbi:alpha/beta fold hydrolase [Actinomycetospora termitidis]|uniref:Alpha/beta hydrolase n=1 Tax=Actinomycetospora termitidis TaxID=3053470 RepID=A0ABT7MC83_9PSEU|nr:alpha/beta hydrolase [Actinomycetospora sp. Odt1-22]MDL5158274.1 alpha/beta hydrolase [Actinomycetospora sp. Odt1-22]